MKFSVPPAVVAVIASVLLVGVSAIPVERKDRVSALNAFDWFNSWAGNADESEPAESINSPDQPDSNPRDDDSPAKLTSVVSAPSRADTQIISSAGINVLPSVEKAMDKKNLVTLGKDDGSDNTIGNIPWSAGNAKRIGSSNDDQGVHEDLNALIKPDLQDPSVDQETNREDEAVPDTAVTESDRETATEARQTDQREMTAAGRGDVHTSTGGRNETSEQKTEQTRTEQTTESTSEQKTQKTEQARTEQTTESNNDAKSSPMSADASFVSDSSLNRDEPREEDATDKVAHKVPADDESSETTNEELNQDREHEHSVDDDHKQELRPQESIDHLNEESKITDEDAQNEEDAQNPDVLHEDNRGGSENSPAGGVSSNTTSATIETTSSVDSSNKNSTTTPLISDEKVHDGKADSEPTSTGAPSTGTNTTAVPAPATDRLSNGKVRIVLDKSRTPTDNQEAYIDETPRKQPNFLPVWPHQDSDKDEKHSVKRVPMMVGLGVGAGVALVVIVVVIGVVRRRRRRASHALVPQTDPYV